MVERVATQFHRLMGELKARFIQNFKDTCKQPMSIVDLTNCKQEDGESTTHWVRRVKEIIHSSDKMDAGSAVLMLEKNCRFEPLKQKLGHRLAFLLLTVSQVHNRHRLLICVFEVLDEPGLQLRP